MIDFPRQPAAVGTGSCPMPTRLARRDRKSTRLNSSHLGISYAVFCLKKKKKNQIQNKNTKNNKPENEETKTTDHARPTTYDVSQDHKPNYNENVYSKPAKVTR